MEEREKQIFLSPEIAGRLAAIDIGTNSMRLIVAEPMRGGNYRILDEEKESNRLGVSLSKTGKLDPLAIEKSLAALRRMKQIAEGFQVTQTRTIATCAVREASNGDEFVRRAREELGIDIEVINAEQEALLAFFSVQRAFDLTDKHVAVADIGGGSTEIVLAYGNLVEAIYTTQLGAVRLSEMFGNGPGMAGDDFLKMVDYVDRHLRKHTKNPAFIPHMMFGSGGTFTSLASMVMAGKHQGSHPARGYQVTRAEVRHLLERLRKLPLRDRSAVPGLSSDRVDIIVAGLAIVDRVMDRLQVNLLQVHNRGVRDGLLLTMIDQSLGTPNGTGQPVRDAAIERLSISAGGEIEHGRHVAKMAGLIYAQLVDEFDLEPTDQALLETAARLQDVGYLIDYEEHHKHSYQLILNSRLAGFTPGELELIANVARYHRGANPKRKHGNFRRLSSRDQERVRCLAAILRVAGGLDRSHTQQVRGLTVTHKGGTTEIRVKSARYPDLDIWGARRRVELFEKVFDTRLKIEWDESSAADEPPPDRQSHHPHATDHPAGDNGHAGDASHEQHWSIGL
ncbi:MAG TPA: Ppx/GppA phosphatase family protein [Pirellulales bacterium]|nr:Ppx/GppA phosphatase family protein [Pirellulales bacterium]